MGTKIRLWLVRHGESEANLDNSVNLLKADHAINLSPEGKQQAVLAGEELGSMLSTLAKKEPLHVRVYRSPYRRTRETEIGLLQGMEHHHIKIAPKDRVESIFLRELEFGVFDGIPDEDLVKIHPVEAAHYQKQKDQEGEFFARMHLGESRADVCARVQHFFGTLQRDIANHPITDAVIVSHGVTVRAILMQWLHHPYEWYQQERNPANCSIRRLTGGRDDGYVFHGFRPLKGIHEAQERREEGVIEVESSLETDDTVCPKLR
jgi:2,3-bisphosphoglycerate-dependent phosphoglycerate mutase